MKTSFLFLLGLLHGMLLLAQTPSGVYSYSRGLNKASSHCYVFPYTADSVFVYLHGVGAAPEFNTDVVRGWVQYNKGQGSLTYNTDTLLFSFLPQSLRIQTRVTNTESALPGQYRLTSKQIKQMSAMLFPHPSFNVKPGADTVLPCFSVPATQAPMQHIAFSRGWITVLDSFRQFYLVEHPLHKRAFLWVPQTQFVTPKIMPRKKL